MLLHAGFFHDGINKTLLHNVMHALRGFATFSSCKIDKLVIALASKIRRPVRAYCLELQQMQLEISLMLGLAIHLPGRLELHHQIQHPCLLAASHLTQVPHLGRAC